MLPASRRRSWLRHRFEKRYATFCIPFLSCRGRAADAALPILKERHDSGSSLDVELEYRIVGGYQMVVKGLGMVVSDLRFCLA